MACHPAGTNHKWWTVAVDNTESERLRLQVYESMKMMSSDAIKSNLFRVIMAKLEAIERNKFPRKTKRKVGFIKRICYAIHVHANEQETGILSFCSVWSGKECAEMQLTSHWSTIRRECASTNEDGVPFQFLWIFPITSCGQVWLYYCNGIIFRCCSLFSSGTGIIFASNLNEFLSPTNSAIISNCVALDWIPSTRSN